MRVLTAATDPFRPRQRYQDEINAAVVPQLIGPAQRAFLGKAVRGVDVAGPRIIGEYVEPEARLCTGICREELTLFQRVLESEVAVERVTHILEGAGRCAYRVTPL